MHFTKFAFLALGILMMANASPASAKKADDEKLASDVRDAMTRFEEKDSTFKKTTESVVGYAIFPEVAKGGFIVGGSGGRGEVYEGGKLIGYGKLSEGTIGAQVGGQKFSQIILFKTKSALNRFKKNRFELSAQATANASDQGGAAKAKYADGVAIIILPTSGLMADASIGGQKLKFIPLADSKK
jgi:lipid-binding SYLF domain-containing protein